MSRPNGAQTTAELEKLVEEYRVALANAIASEQREVRSLTERIKELRDQKEECIQRAVETERFVQPILQDLRKQLKEAKQALEDETVMRKALEEDKATLLTRLKEADAQGFLG